ncbi:MAG: glycosyltransferase [Patescibacteria group bacterium]|nr:glycosyltransferase [Patescibacteria group bacterium]
MKICIINHLFYPDRRGGTESVVELLAKELKKLNHKIFVISCGEKFKITTEEELNNIKIYRIGFEKYFSFQNINSQSFIKRLLWRINQFHNKYSFNAVYSILEKEKPDLVLSHGILGLGYNILNAINVLNLNHIHTIHDIQLIEASGVLLPNTKIDSLKNKIYTIFTKNLFKGVKKIVSPSEILLKLHLKRGFFPIADTKIIYNPLIMSEKIEISKSDELRCLYLGMLEEQKGVNMLMRVFKKLDQNKFSLKIAGRGSLSEKIKNIAQTMSNVSFEGEFDWDIEKKLFENTDLLIVPSLCFENSPMVIYEAMKSGIPVIASRIGGIPEIIINEKNGYLFNTGDENDLRKKLEYISQNKNLIEYMKNSCIEKAKEFEISKYIKNLLEFNKL